MASRRGIDVNGLYIDLKPVSVVMLDAFPGMHVIDFASLWR